jgi:hypothetical protein
MKRIVFLVGVVTSLLVTMASISYASINLNSSRSNIYRIFYPPSVTAAQAAAILKRLDKASPQLALTEDQVRQILTTEGVNRTLIKQIEIIPAAGSNEKIPTVLLLDDPETPAAALSAACPSCKLVRHARDAASGMATGKTTGSTLPAPGGQTLPMPGGSAFPTPPAKQ